AANPPTQPLEASPDTMSNVKYQLDREVYQAIRALEDAGTPLEVHTVYEAIKTSNSSLGRRKKALLEDSITRGLRMLKRQREEEDDEGDSNTPPPSEPSKTRRPGVNP